MSKLVLLFLAVAFIDQAISKEINLNNILSGGLGKSVKTQIDKHIQNIETKHVPFIKTLTDAGCEIKPIVVSESHINARLEECVNLTKGIGDIARAILDSYELLADYINQSITSSGDASQCLKEENVGLVSICLLRVATEYSTQIIKINDKLKKIVTDEVKWTGDIVQYFPQCFGPLTDNYQDMAGIYANKYCKN